MTLRERHQFDDLYGHYLQAETARRALIAENEAFVPLLEKLLEDVSALLAVMTLEALRAVPIEGRPH